MNNDDTTLVEYGKALKAAAELKLSVCFTSFPGSWGTVMVGRSPWINPVPMAFERYDEQTLMSATCAAIYRAVGIASGEG